MSKWQVVGYRVTHLSSSDQPWSAEIRCYESEDLASPETGLIRFWPDPAAVPADGWVAGEVNGVPIVNFPVDRFNDVMTTIRDEDYVIVTTFAYTSGGDYVRGWGVSAGMEPAGDMEP